jgi:hypothetical protein
MEAKKKAFGLFTQGHLPAEVIGMMPSIPAATIYKWFGIFKAGEQRHILDPIGELLWVRQVLREQIKNPDKTETPLVTQAAQAYLRSIQIELAIPDKSAQNDELPDTERANRITSLLDRARARRDRQANS